MADWQVHLAESDDMSRIGELTDHARGKQLKVTMNKAGSFDFNLPMSTDLADELTPISRCIIVSKNKEVVWSGPIWTTEEDFTAGKISVSSVGWFQLLHRRYLVDYEFGFVDYNDGDMVWWMLNYANNQIANSVAQDTRIIQGTNTSERLITYTIPRWSNIGEEIEKLTQSENGFDFLVDPETRIMNLFSWSEYQENGLMFAFNWGPDNSTDVIRSSSAEEMGNDWYVVGPSSTARMTDSASVSTYGLHQKVINITEADEPSILPIIAAAELAVNKDPRVIIQFTPRPPSDENDFPSAFEDYNIRDKVYLSARRDNATIDSLPVRIWGFTLDINENNIEKVSSMQTTFQQG